MRWIIHYGDRQTFSDEDGDALDAPALNVQCIVQAADDPNNSLGRGLQAEFDFYWFEPEAEEQWVGGDIFGLWDYLTRPGPKKVIFGRSIDTRTHMEIRMEALAAWDNTTP